MALERELILSSDLDGVQFVAPPPLRTTRRLWQGDLALPLPEDDLIGEYRKPTSLAERFSSQWSIFFHQIRPIRQDGLEGLKFFRLAAEAQERNLSLVALSGREKDKHDMTEAKLNEAGYWEHFVCLFLNQGNKSARWKRLVVKTLVEEGLNVIHIEDDIRAGFHIASLAELYPEAKIQVYVLRNLSNHPWLLKRAGVSLPNNLQLVNSFKEAAYDFAQKLDEGSL